jgi:hypothetical protein
MLNIKYTRKLYVLKMCTLKEIRSVKPWLYIKMFIDITLTLETLFSFEGTEKKFWVMNFERTLHNVDRPVWNHLTAIRDLFPWKSRHLKYLWNLIRCEDSRLRRNRPSVTFVDGDVHLMMRDTTRDEGPHLAGCPPSLIQRIRSYAMYHENIWTYERKRNCSSSSSSSLVVVVVV